jgi:AcrR family transcriptional regulator
VTLVRSNKIGQQMGARGAQTRSRLLAAAETLLRTVSPMDLNAAAIAREAETSPATFYVYFTDVRDLLFDLTGAAAPAFAAMFPRPDSLLVPARRGADASILVAAVNAAWDRNTAVLLYRNLEADRGDAAFDTARTAWAQPVLVRIVTAMQTTSSTRRNLRQAQADAVILLAAIERIAATTHRAPTNGPPADDLAAALVRMVCQALA